MRKILEYFAAGGLLGLLFGGGIYSGKLYYQPVVAPYAPKPQPVFSYTVYHTSVVDGSVIENVIEANAVDVKGNCVMFFKDFHVVAIVCQGPNEMAVIE